MTEDNEVRSEERIAALIRCMQPRVQRGSASRYYFSHAFEGLAVSASVWDTLSFVQAEMSKASQHLEIAFEAVAGWLLRSARARHPPRAPRLGS
jgi:hypothetical protein